MTAKKGSSRIETRSVAIKFNGAKISAPYGTTVMELLESRAHAGTLPPLGALVSCRLRGLHYPLVSDCEVRTVDYCTKEGAAIYRRTASFLLYEAVAELFPGSRVEVGQSVGHGYFFDVDVPAGGSLTNKDAVAIDRTMKEIVRRDIPLIPARIAVEEAIETFERNGYPEKAQLLQTYPHTTVWWLDLGAFQDFLHGPVAPSSGAISLFAISPYEGGVILRFPDKKFQMRPPRGKQNKLFAVYRETRAWNQEIGVHNVGQLNAAVLRDETPEIIRVAEGFQEKKLANIADQIASSRDSPRLILVAGPSSSGKTTFMKRLGVQLRVNGIKPVALSMDNYYVNRTKTPKNPDGMYDFESLGALDVRLLNEHLSRLMGGELVKTPVFSFTTGRRYRENTIPLTLEEGQVLVMEGIHCLNEKISQAVSRSLKLKIYVSALTQLIIDPHSRIFTSDTRLIRRIVRDRLYRGYSAEETVRQWTSVRAGENRNIFPFQEEADVMFNSALVYEMCVLKNYAERFLLTVPRNVPEYTEAHRLLSFLEFFVPIFPEEVPENSILREFIGGSTFRY
jgi:uridine kinase